LIRFLRERHQIQIQFLIEMHQSQFLIEMHQSQIRIEME